MSIVKKDLATPDPNVREISNITNVKSKTDLSRRQIEAVNKLHTLGIVFGNPLVSVHLEDFMELLLSKERKSRGEMVEAIKSRVTDIVNKAKVGLLG